jgi:nicotinate-nucleotide adenylyltransferase
VTARRVGILGGTFNPPHLGHLIAAQEAHLQLGLDRVLLMVAGIPPHKAGEPEPGPEHRLAMCRLAIGEDARFEVSALEIERGGPSYTVDTLWQLHSRAPDNELYLIVGGDAAAGLPTWREPERVLSLARLAVAKRRGTSRATIERALAALPGGERAVFFRMPGIAVSSTMLRRRVAHLQPITYLVPAPVASYIHQNRLYGGSPS